MLDASSRIIPLFLAPGAL